MATKKVFLDPGHGGKDPGACNGKRTEASDVLRLGLAIKKKLLAEYNNVSVGMSRTSDIYESPTKKAQDGNNFGADLFVSLHRDSASASANGYSSLVFSNSGKAKILADKLNKRMEEIGFRKRGTVVRTGLAVLRTTSMPALLGENGFISNSSDNKLFDSKFDEIVEAYVLSIAETLNLEKKATTTTYTSHIKIAHATNGPEPIKGGEAGDQAGQEVCIREWYSKPWTHVIRFKDANIREKIAKFFELTVKNDNVGYDQSQRNTFFKQLKKNNFIVSKINTKCETDCSALASSACVYADRTLEEVVYPNEKGSTTRNIRERLSSTGKVDVLTADKYISSDKYALRGDLYLAEGKHIVCALENGSKVEIEAGSTVKIVKGAVYGGASYGTKVSDFCIGEKYTITKVATHVQDGDNVKEALLKDISSWVPVKYLERV